MCFAMEKFTLEQVLKVNLLAEMEKRKFAFPIKELPVDTRVSKENRIRALQPKFFNKEIFIHKSMMHLYHQIIYYPLGTKHDDLLDALKNQLQITFPSPNRNEETKEYPDLSHQDRKVWQEAMKMGVRKVRRTVRL